MVTRPTDPEVLQSFYSRVRPYAGGWRRAVETEPDARGSVTSMLLAWLLGCVLVYLTLFGTGFALYGDTLQAVMCAIASVLSAIGMFRILKRTSES